MCVCVEYRNRTNSPRWHVSPVNPGGHEHSPVIALQSTPATAAAVTEHLSPNRPAGQRSAHVGPYDPGAHLQRPVSRSHEAPPLHAHLCSHAGPYLPTGQSTHQDSTQRHTRSSLSQTVAYCSPAYCSNVELYFLLRFNCSFILKQ